MQSYLHTICNIVSQLTYQSTCASLHKAVPLGAPPAGLSTSVAVTCLCNTFTDAICILFLFAVPLMIKFYASYDLQHLIFHWHHNPPFVPCSVFSFMLRLCIVSILAAVFCQLWRITQLCCVWPSMATISTR